MLYLISILVFIVFSFVPTVVEEGLNFVFAFGFFGVGILVQLIAYYNHLSDEEQIKKLTKDKEIHKSKAEDLLVEVKLYLIEKFPEHESKVFENITKNTADFLAIDYPEIKANETFMKAVNSIIDLKGKIYDCDIRINAKQKDLAVRKRAMILTCLPILPKVNTDRE